MCGIAGEWGWNGRPREQSAVAAMIGRLGHRGPEARACWLSSDGEIALAYTQLSFFEGARTQPVSNARNSIFVVCNGEIYNHRELADLARQSGVAPAMRSDIEIIPYLYELRGTSSFSLLRGEFAFALYDSENRLLYLVRDRIGVKPLYFHLAEGSILFASEIKALFVHQGVSRNFDNASIATKLFGITLSGRTAFSGIREVKPGSYVKVAAGQIFEQSYWSPTFDGSGPAKPLAELAHEFREIFEEAVSIRLQGNYPIGAYLSGGIDSSAVLASMVRVGATSLKAFTIQFEDQRFDESPEAINVASRLGVEHHLVPVRNRDLEQNFLQSIWHCEIPVINSHGTAKFLLSRAASQHVKGVMTGEGSDELFAGYPYFGRNTGGARSKHRSAKPRQLVAPVRIKPVDFRPSADGTCKRCHPPHSLVRLRTLSRSEKPVLCSFDSTAAQSGISALLLTVGCAGIHGAGTATGQDYSDDGYKRRSPPRLEKRPTGLYSELLGGSGGNGAFDRRPCSLP